jgi:uncharacterized protein YjbI with pentapeptide repeats
LSSNQSDEFFKIITDEPSSASDFQKYATQLSKIVVNSTPRFTVGIYGGWGTGKTTLMEMIKNTLDEKYSKDVETVWFDSWRYEREEYSAMVPLLRTITLSLDDRLERMKNSDTNGRKEQVLTKLRATFTKIGSAVIRNTTANIGLKTGGIFEAGLTFPIGNIIDDYKSEGYFISGQKRVYFHKHISEHLNEVLHKIRYDDKDKLVYDFRLVIFVDDLDRCTPDRALELLESVKTFFDIEGIIYVIGMDPKTIDPIIKSKYGQDNDKIDGMDYLQKIVQVPFQIPLWNASQLGNTIRDMIEKTGIPDTEIDKILKNVKLITGAAQLNPRDVKRFVNIIILSKYIYEENITDIEKIIAVQAFYFRGNRWLNFLKLITPFDNRIQFLKGLLFLWLVEEIRTIEDLHKEIINANDKRKNYIFDRGTSEILKRLIELNDIDLYLFLINSAPTLFKIVKMDKYLRVVESVDIADVSGISSDIDREKQILLLRKEDVVQFNQHKSSIRVYLPLEDLGKLNLKGIDMSGAFLLGTKLKGADLSHSNLAAADFMIVDLSGANLSHSNLEAADLRGADLRGADLTGADLTGADFRATSLAGAGLSGANLSHSNLAAADLTGAELTGAELTGADLTGAELTGADLTGADLTGADLTGADLTGADLTGADLTGADLSGTSGYHGR